MTKPTTDDRIARLEHLLERFMGAEDRDGILQECERKYADMTVRFSKRLQDENARLRDHIKRLEDRLDKSGVTPVNPARDETAETDPAFGKRLARLEFWHNEYLNRFYDFGKIEKMAYQHFIRNSPKTQKTLMQTMKFGCEVPPEVFLNNFLPSEPTPKPPRS